MNRVAVVGEIVVAALGLFGLIAFLAIFNWVGFLYDH
jgi:hypothetical protein